MKLMNVLQDLERTIDHFHQQSLTDLFTQIIAGLKKHYSFEMILEALARYTQTRDDWSRVTEHIRLALFEVSEARAKLCGNEVDEDDAR